MVTWIQNLKFFGVATLGLGLRPRQGFARVWAKGKARESHFMLLGVQKSVREWTFPLPSELPFLGIKVPMDSRIFIKRLQGSKFIGLNSSLYNWKALGTWISELGFRDPFKQLKQKLWPHEGPGVKLAIWLLTTKSWELPQFPYVKVAYDILLKNSQQRL
jgi:hypothetical protein